MPDAALIDANSDWPRSVVREAAQHVRFTAAIPSGVPGSQLAEATFPVGGLHEDERVRCASRPLGDLGEEAFLAQPGAQVHQ